MAKKRILFLVLVIVALSFLVTNGDYLYNLFRITTIETGIDVEEAKQPPVILLHGFNPLHSKRIGELSLKEMQLRLSKDLDYEDKGILIDGAPCSAIAGDKIIIRASYFGSIESITIEDYTANLREIIRKVMNCTKSEQVDVITHSMGGIVARNYIKNVDNRSVRKLIMLATPNHGGLYNLGDLADYFAEEWQFNESVDFIEISEKHKFMDDLNQGRETPGGIEYYTVAGNIDGKGDGIIIADSVSLEGEKARATVKCLHLFITSPSICPKAYEFVKEVIKEE